MPTTGNCHPAGPDVSEARRPPNPPPDSPAARREILGPWRPLGHGDVARRFHEGRELFVGHFGGIHPEAVHVDPMHRAGIFRGLHSDRVAHVRRCLRPHGKFAARNPHHPLRRRAGRPVLVFNCGKKLLCRDRLRARRLRAQRGGGDDHHTGDGHPGEQRPPLPEAARWRGDLDRRGTLLGHFVAMNSHETPAGAG